MHRAGPLLASLLVLTCAPVSAQGAQSASLRVTFTPERLGETTTVSFAIRIHPLTSRVPPPLAALDVRYPSQLGVAISGLGVATCSQARLEASGPEGCPADSHMGQGSATAEIPVGPEIVRETANVAILRAPENEEHLALLFYAEGRTPVDAQLVFGGQLLRGPTSNDETIHIQVPLVPSLPGAPDVAVTELHATFGPRNLTYYEHVHNRLVAYHPQGILLPKKCPRGGFAFSAALAFLDGSHTLARTDVPCPRT